MMPQPPWSFSSFFMGGTFMMSKTRYRMKPIMIVFKLRGMNKNAGKMFANSSITMKPGSFCIDPLSTIPDDITPAVKNIANALIYRKVFAWSNKHSKSPAKLPAVPGAIGKYPIPPTVAIKSCIFLFFFILCFPITNLVG